MSQKPTSLRSRAPLAWTLALRYLKSTRRDAFSSFLSAVAVGGIALGVAALVIVLALLSGFQHALREEVLSRTPEIEIELPAEADARAVRTAVEAVDGVRSASLSVLGQGWVTSGGRAEPVEVVGFDGPVPDTFPGAAGARSGLYLSQSLATRWALMDGEGISIVSPRPTLTPLGPQPRVRTAPLAGLFESSDVVGGERVAVPLALAESLFGARDRRMVVATGGLQEALEVAPRLAAALPEGSRLATWKDLNRGLLFALSLEKALTFVAVSLVLLVASLALVADLALVVSKKRREIGMLGALGAPARLIRRTFLLLGGAITAIGVLSGAALGIGVSLMLDWSEAVPVPGEVYFVDFIPFRVEVPDVAGVLALSLLLAFSASVYAARRAAALVPVTELYR